MKKIKKKQNKNNLQLAYSGNVTIKLVKDDKVIDVINGHNHGTFRLFEFIATCLIGVYESASSPKYIQVFHVTSEESAETELASADSLTGLIPLGSSSIETDTANNLSTAKLTFTIPGSVFAEGIIPNYFVLYNYKNYTDQKKPMAMYYVDTGYEDIDRDSNIIVVWELQVGNATVTGE